MSASDRYDLLRRIAIKNKREPFTFEKDIWVVQILKILFEAPFGKDLVFKGGTSLSKVYNAIRRFSEDLDITYDIRAFAPDIVGDSEEGKPFLPIVARRSAGLRRFESALRSGRGKKPAR